MYAKLAWRNIWRNRKRTAITLSAIVFAAVAAVFMQSLNRGSQEQMRDRLMQGRFIGDGDSGVAVVAEGLAERLGLSRKRMAAIGQARHFSNQNGRRATPRV